MSGNARWNVYEVSCDGITVYVSATSNARARAACFRLAMDARGSRRADRREVFRGLRSRLAAYVPPDVAVLHAGAGR